MHIDIGGAPGHCTHSAVDEEQRPLDLEWYVGSTRLECGGQQIRFWVVWDRKQ